MRKAEEAARIAREAANIAIEDEALQKKRSQYTLKLEEQRAKAVTERKQRARDKRVARADEIKEAIAAE